MVTLNFKTITIIVLSIIIILLTVFCCDSEPKIIEVPVKIEVPIPVIEKQFDTIEKPVPVYITVKENTIDSTLLKEYNNLKTQLEKDSLFKKAIQIKEYTESIEDDTLTINLYAKVRGDLLEYQLGYKTKPRNIDLDTTIKIAIPQKPSVFIGPFVRIPTSNLNNTGITGGVQLLFVPKKRNVGYSINYDFVEKAITAGFLFSF